MLDALDRDSVVLRYLLESVAAERPGAPLVHFEDGTTWTGAQALSAAYATANELRRAGVEQDSVVAVALPNGEAYLRAWWGAAVLGAAVVPVNTAHRGPMLRNLMTLARPHLVVAEDAFRTQLIAAAGDLAPTAFDPLDLNGSNTSAPALARPIEPWDAISLAPTSGSTGPSKLVRVTHAQSRMGSEVNCERFGLGENDVLLADTPMVHVSALYFMHASIGNRIAIAVRTRPALDAYWEVARDTGATICQLYSTMITHLEGQPRRAAERDHYLRYAVTVPLPPDPEAFRERFGIAQLGVGYGLTEVTSPISLGPTDPLRPGSIGTLRPGFEVRLVDENDVDAPPGQPGEAIVRSHTPWLITTEYVGNPEATAAAWRNGWFHTGDLLRRDDDGTYYYVDRLKDSIRRRGQNVSSFEVESVIRDYPGISDAAVVPERGDVAVEDEIKAWLVTDEGAEIDFVDLLRFCNERLAHYMVPRYFEIIDDFPRTASAKVRKSELRALGTSPLTWDRLAHGVDIRRTGLVKIGAKSR